MGCSHSSTLDTKIPNKKRSSKTSKTIQKVFKKEIDEIYKYIYFIITPRYIAFIRKYF